MLRSSSLSLRALALALGLALAACGGGGDGGNNQGNHAGSGGIGGQGGEGGTGGTGGEPAPCTAPVIERIEPDSGPVGATVKIFGRCFSPNVAKNKVAFAQVPSAVYGAAEDGTQLETAVPVNAITGQISVWSDYGQGLVRKDGPTFTVTNERPAPAISEVTPAYVTVGASTDLTISISGSGFMEDSKVIWDNDTELAATYTSSTSMNAVIPGGSFATVGTHRIRVYNAPPGGGTSGAAIFSVVPPINLISAVATADDKVLLTFDQPVHPDIAVDERYYRLNAATGAQVSVQKAVGAGAKGVLLTSGSTMRPNVEYVVNVRPEFMSLYGGTIGTATANFRGFGSDPIESGLFGEAGCGVTSLSGPGMITAAGDTLFVTERTGQQVQLVGTDGVFQGFLGYDGSSAGYHAADETAIGCAADGSGTGSNLANAFAFPRGGVAVDTTGKLYVADTGNNRLFRYDATGAIEPGFGTGTNWQSPVILGFVENAIWIANGDEKIYRLPASGFPLTPIGGGVGLGAGTFKFGLADGKTPALATWTDASNLLNVYVTDPANQRVQWFQSTTAKGWIGKGHTAFGGNVVDCLGTGTCGGSGNGEFLNPTGVTVDPNGRIWVGDEAGGGRLQKFAPNGAWEMSFSLGYLPGGVAVDGDGFLWVSDPAHNTLHRYTL